MVNLDLGQDVATKREKKYITAHKVAKCYLLYLAVRMRRYGSLIKINPSDNNKVKPVIKAPRRPLISANSLNGFFQIFPPVVSEKICK